MQLLVYGAYQYITAEFGNRGLTSVHTVLHSRVTQTLRAKPVVCVR
jgi:hypothetical protein